MAFWNMPLGVERPENSEDMPHGPDLAPLRALNVTVLGFYNPTIIERLTFLGPGYSAPKQHSVAR